MVVFFHYCLLYNGYINMKKSCTAHNTVTMQLQFKNEIKLDYLCCIYRCMGVGELLFTVATAEYGFAEEGEEWEGVVGHNILSCHFGMLPLCINCQQIDHYLSCNLTQTEILFTNICHLV